MRQLKFRYWNGSAILQQEAFINHLNKYIARNDKHLMQFTGLLDKQGVEIYEGDVLKVGYNNLGTVEVYFKDGKFNVSVYKISECEVIGNIYENPELLESK